MKCKLFPTSLVTTLVVLSPSNWTSAGWWVTSGGFWQKSHGRCLPGRCVWTVNLSCVPQKMC